MTSLASDTTATDTTDTTDTRSAYRIQAIERAVAILGAFSADEPDLRVSDIAQRLGLHKSTVHRFLVNLEAAGMVEKTPRTGRYRLGLRLFELGSLVMDRINLWDEALPFLEDLVRTTGETGHMAVLEAGEAVYVERVEARRALRVPSAVGRGYPAHATNLGKVLLAFRPVEEVDEIIAQKGLPGFTPHTITTADALHADLATIRERGFSVDNEEYDEGLRCIGAPVWDHTGGVVAAIGIGGPVTRVTPDRIESLADMVIEQAKSLSRRLGAHHRASVTTPAVRVRVSSDSHDPRPQAVP